MDSNSMNPYNAGWDAKDKGETIDDNPYCYGMPEFEQWISGWNDSYTNEKESSIVYDSWPNTGYEY